MTQQRLDRIEDEFETVKQLLASAASYAEMAHQGQAELTVKQDRTQVQLDRLSVKLDQTDTRLNEFIFQTQRLFNQQAEWMGQAEGRIEQLEAIAVGLDRNFLEFQRTTNATIERFDRNFLELQRTTKATIERLDQNSSEFQRTTNAALERIDRILDYLLRQQQGKS